MKLSGFLISILLFSAAIAVFFYFLQPVLPAKAVFANFIFIQIFILIATIGFHAGLINSGEKSNQAFIRYFMGATAAKLFLYMLVMIGYALFNKETAFGFIIHFFMMYLLYTAFEVTLIYKKFSSHLKASNH